MIDKIKLYFINANIEILEKKRARSEQDNDLLETLKRHKKAHDRISQRGRRKPSQAQRV